MVLLLLLLLLLNRVMTYVDNEDDNDDDDALFFHATLNVHFTRQHIFQFIFAVRTDDRVLALIFGVGRVVYKVAMESTYNCGL